MQQQGVKNIFLSGLAITNTLLEQLIKDFSSSIHKICSRTWNFNCINNAKISLNKVYRDGLHLWSKGNMFYK